jgi:zinc transport system permease protein
MISLLGMLIVVIVTLLYPAFLAVSFDQEYAMISGLPTRALHLLLLIMIAGSVVVLIQMVGIILVIALLTLPAAIARPFSRTLGIMMVLSTVVGIIITINGIFLSWMFDLPSGSTIILIGVTGYLLTTGIKKGIGS